MERIMADDFGQGAWVGNTTLHPLGILILVVCLYFIFTSKRKNAYIPFFTLLCAVSPAQRIVIATIDFNFFRLTLLALCIRVFIRSENNFFKLHKIDKIFIAYLISFTTIYIISSGKFGDPVGRSTDLLMLYFSARCLIRKTEDVEKLFHYMALISIPVCILFLIENTTGRNLFSIFGGVHEITKVREGKLRCQGPYPHAIIAGCFWAILFPIFIGLFNRSKKTIYLIAAAAAITIIITTSSSTPLMALVAGPIFLLLYKVVKHVKNLFYLSLLMLLILHLVMAQPVWHLIARVSAVAGSTSYYRYKLIDAFINNASEWFFLGTGYTGHWFYGAQDLTNQFVLIGVRGGFLSLLLFVVLIWYFYKNIYAATMASKNKFFIWSIGSAMFVSCVSFIGVSYFGQPIYLFYILFPIALNMSLYERENRRKRNEIRPTK